MNIIYSIFTAIWVIIACRCVTTKSLIGDYRHLNHLHGLTKREITVITILLLSGLNICIGLIYVLCPTLSIAYDLKLSEYLNIGSSLFQILISYFVLTSIRKIKKVKVS